MPRVACREEGSDWLTHSSSFPLIGWISSPLHSIPPDRCAWLNKIVLLSGPRCNITQRSVPHGHVETIIAMLTSSSSFALIGHRTLELYFFFFYYYYFLWNFSIPRTLHRHHLPYLHPNPHSSPPPSSLSPPQPALFADHFRFRSLPVSITSGSHLVLFADPFLIWG